MSHTVQITGQKGTGKTTLALSFAQYAVARGAKAKFYDLDGHGDQVLDRQPPLIRDHTELVNVTSLRSMADDLESRDPEQYPVVIVDSLSQVEKLAMRYDGQSSFGVRGVQSVLPLGAMAVAPTREQKATTRRLQYGVWDRLKELEADFRVFTVWEVDLQKQRRTYDKVNPLAQFESDVIIRTGKTGVKEGFDFWAKVTDIKSGAPGAFLRDPGYHTLVQRYPMLVDR